MRISSPSSMWVAVSAVVMGLGCAGTEFKAPADKKSAKGTDASPTPSPSGTPGPNDPDPTPDPNGNPFKIGGDGEAHIPTVGSGGSIAAKELAYVDDGSGKVPMPKFAMMVNRPSCTFCHTYAHGDVVTLFQVTKFPREVNNAYFSGKWILARDIDPQVSVTVDPTKSSDGSNIQPAGGLFRNSKDPILPKDLNNDGMPDFPLINFGALGGKVHGLLAAKGVKIQNVYDGDLLLIGTKAQPIEIDGEILVKGRLVIKGWYRGQGTIYSTENVFIPADLRAVKTPFPYPDDPALALAKAKASLQARDDALAIASAKSVIIGDPIDRGPPDRSAFSNGYDEIPLEDRESTLKIDDVFTWISKERFDKEILEAGPLECLEGGHPSTVKWTISRVDAFLYAKAMIGGRARHNAFALFGGAISNSYHIITNAPNCPEGIHPVFGLSQRYQHIMPDWRVQSGLLLLKQISGYF